MTMGLLDGKVAIITGAGGGLGRAHALLFAKEGAAVVVNDLGGARDGAGGGHSMADQVVKEIQAAGSQADANYDSVATVQCGENICKTAVDAFGKVDILVNNAGILRDKTLVNTDEASWDIVVQVHLKGTYCVTRPVFTHMKNRPGRRDREHELDLRPDRQLRPVELRRREGGHRRLHAL